MTKWDILQISIQILRHMVYNKSQEETMEQIERIMDMEQCLDDAAKTIREIGEALSSYERIRPEIRRLSDYYGSDLWRRDFEDDEAGKLPMDLKRGVLSEDAVYNLLTEDRELLAWMQRLGSSGQEKYKESETEHVGI